MDFEGKRSGQIPAFGDWDNANEMPITQYFESARQAGLVRHASALSAHQCDAYMTYNARGRGSGSGGACSIDLYASDFQKPSVGVVAVAPRKTRGAVNNGDQGNRRRCGCPPHAKEQKQQQQQRIKQVQVKVYDVVDVKQQLPRPRTRSQQLFYDQKQQFPKHSATATVAATAGSVNAKPVDEDLYKIPPELLLQSSKRKKMLGFFSKCLVPPCKA